MSGLCGVLRASLRSGVRAVPAERAGVRSLSSCAVLRTDFPFQSPGPPPLPKEDQLEFERLLRENESRCARLPR